MSIKNRREVAEKEKVARKAESGGGIQPANRVGKTHKSSKTTKYEKGER